MVVPSIIFSFGLLLQSIAYSHNPFAIGSTLESLGTILTDIGAFLAIVWMPFAIQIVLRGRRQ